MMSFLDVEPFAKDLGNIDADDVETCPGCRHGVLGIDHTRPEGIVWAVLLKRVPELDAQSLLPNHLQDEAFRILQCYVSDRVFKCLCGDAILVAKPSHKRVSVSIQT